MRKEEQRLWDRMRYSLKDKVYLERMENVVNPGRPDVDAVWRGVVLPIELKVRVGGWPERDATPVLGCKGLNQNQLNWWLNWRRWGGSGFILVGIQGEIFSVPAASSDRVNSMNSKELYAHKTTWMDLVEQIMKEASCIRSR